MRITWPRVRRVIVALGLGAMTAVLVAWGIAIRGIDFQSRYESVGAMQARDADEAWLLDEPVVRDGSTEYRTQRVKAEAEDDAIVITKRAGDPRQGFRRVMSMPDRRHLQDEVDVTRYEFQFGWPARCVWAAMDRGRMSGGAATERNLLVIRGGQIGFPYVSYPGFAFTRSYAVPYGVVARGLIFNAIVFGAVWMGVILWAARIRRSIRRRKGLCAICKYDLRGLAEDAVCPECGKAR